MAAWLSSTGVSHYNILSHLLSVHLSTVNSSPCPQTPAPSCCAFQGTRIPAWGMYDWGRDCLILISFRLPQTSRFTQHQMFLLWPWQVPWCGNRTPASVPPPTEGRSSPTITPVFPPSSFILPSFVWFYILFCWSASPVHSALHALLCLKVYSWCIHGGRCTPHPPTPLPSCSPVPVLVIGFSAFPSMGRCKNWGSQNFLLKISNYLKSFSIYFPRT